MKIMKFGGTSVKDASSMLQVLSIVKSSTNDGLVVVLSACSGITDLLNKAINDSIIKIPNEEIDTFLTQHINLASKLIIDIDLLNITKSKIHNLVKQFLDLCTAVNSIKECTPRTVDAALSIGEQLSTTIFVNACINNNIKAILINANKLIRTNDQYTKAVTDICKTNILINQRLKDYLNSGYTVITQGFIGADENGIITTLGRGGSDYSAAIIGAALSADIIEIWTDVAGVKTADPNKFKDTRTIPLMSYSQIRELSFFGAKVLHPATIKPAIQKNIPIKVLDTFHPSEGYTIINNKTYSNNPTLESILIKENVVYIRINTPANDDSTNIYIDLLTEFRNSNLNLLYSTFNEQYLTFIFEKNPNTYYIIKDIILKYEFYEKDYSLIFISGNNLEKFNQNQYLSSFKRILLQIQPKAQFIGHSNESMILLVSKETAYSSAELIHNYIINHIAANNKK